MGDFGMLRAGAWRGRGELNCRRCGVFFEDSEWPSLPRSPPTAQHRPTAADAGKPAVSSQPDTLLSAKDAGYLRALAKIIEEQKGWKLPTEALLATAALSSVSSLRRFG